LQELGVGSLDRQTHCLFRIDQRGPLGPEFDRTAKNIGVLDLFTWLLANALHANWRDGVARQIPATAHQRGDNEVRILPESAQRRIGLPKSDRHLSSVVLDLKLTLALNQEGYRPGAEASASFLTRTAQGRTAESALGVIIFDKAVEERARTDREFGGRYGFYGSYCYLFGCSGEIAGVTRKDLDQVDLSKPLPEGLDLVDGEHVLIADDPVRFAADCERLAHDGDRFAKFGNIGLQHIHLHVQVDVGR
jgi:hypothetical protein